MSDAIWDPDRPIPGYKYTWRQLGDPRATRFRVSYQRHNGLWRVFELMQREQDRSYWPDRCGFTSWLEAFEWAQHRATLGHCYGVRVK